MTAVSSSPSGLAEVDRQWGGFASGHSYLLVGRAGSGRSALAFQVVRAAVDAERRALVISPREPDALVEVATSIGFDLAAAHQRGRLRLLRIPNAQELAARGPDGLASSYRDLASLVSSDGAECVVIEDFTPLVQFDTFERFREAFHGLVSSLRDCGAMLMVGLGEPGNDASKRLLEVVEGMVAGTIRLGSDGSLQLSTPPQVPAGGDSAPALADRASDTIIAAPQTAATEPSMENAGPDVEAAPDHPAEDPSGPPQSAPQPKPMVESESAEPPPGSDQDSEPQSPEPPAADLKTIETPPAEPPPAPTPPTSDASQAEPDASPTLDAAPEHPGFPTPQEDSAPASQRTPDPSPAGAVDPFELATASIDGDGVHSPEPVAPVPTIPAPQAPPEEATPAEATPAETHAPAEPPATAPSDTGRDESPVPTDIIAPPPPDASLLETPPDIFGSDPADTLFDQGYLADSSRGAVAGRVPVAAHNASPAAPAAGPDAQASPAGGDAALPSFAPLGGSPAEVDPEQAFRSALRDAFATLASGDPFVVVALRMDPSAPEAAHFATVESAVLSALRPTDRILVDDERMRIVVLLPSSEQPASNALFSNLQSHLQGALGDDAERVRQSIGAVTIPNGQPFQRAATLLGYAYES
ncbi:MAG: ATPase domain-containing protein [Bacteroidota bacterium]